MFATPTYPPSLIPPISGTVPGGPGETAFTGGGDITSVVIAVVVFAVIGITLLVLLRRSNRSA